MHLILRPIDVWPGELTKERKLSPFSAPYEATLELLDTECARGHGFTPENTRIRRLRNGRTGRVCRACHRENEAARKGGGAK